VADEPIDAFTLRARGHRPGAHRSPLPAAAGAVMASLWWTERTEHGEVLVFRAGELVYKRWADGNSVLIGAVPRFAYWKP